MNQVYKRPSEMPTNDGWVMHKKTLYNHALIMHMKENEFAEKFKYRRVYGDKKLRFLFER